MNPRLVKQCAAEFVGTFTLIFVGIGVIANNTPTSGLGLLGVAFAHGLAIAVMVTATGAISGGQLNPAVTFGLLVGGQMDVKKSIAYWISQLAAARRQLCCARRCWDGRGFRRDAGYFVEQQWRSGGVHDACNRD